MFPLVGIQYLYMIRLEVDIFEIFIFPGSISVLVLSDIILFLITEDGFT